jgi:hypothetical protein
VPSQDQAKQAVKMQELEPTTMAPSLADESLGNGPVAEEEDQENLNISPSPITQPPSPEVGPDSSRVLENNIKMEDDDDSIYHPTPSTSSLPEPISDGDVDINLREEERTLEVETDIDEEDPIPLIHYTGSWDENGDLILKRDITVSLNSEEPTCNSKHTCPKLIHQAQGIFADGHHSDQEKDDLEVLGHLLLIILTTPSAEGRDMYECLRCPGLPVRNYGRMRSHLENTHGNLLGMVYHKYNSARQLKYLAQQRVNLNHPPIIPTCNVCFMDLGSSIEYIIHTHSCHPHLDKTASFCPECLQPLREISLASHRNLDHTFYCGTCRESFKSLENYLDHAIRLHFPAMLENLSTFTISDIKSNSNLRINHLPWENQWRNIPDPYVRSNDLMPDLYSTKFRQLVESVTPTDLPLYRTLMAYDNSEAVRQNQAGRWYPHEPDQLWWRDTQLQTNLSNFLCYSSTSITYKHQNIYEKEITQGEDSCVACKDNYTHEDSRDRCMEYYSTFSKHHIMDTFSITAETVRNNPLILVGAKVYTYCSNSSQYPVLNLSNVQKNLKYATGQTNGTPVIFQKNGRHIRSFKSYFDTVRRVTKLLSPGNSSLILCEFFLLEPTEDKSDIYLQVLAYLSELITIKRDTKANILVLCPLPKHGYEDTSEDYLLSYKSAALAQSILTLVACKLYIPVLPLSGEITSISLQTLGFGPWSTKPDHVDEPLYNYRGTPTREFRRRFGLVTDKIAKAWALTISQIPFLRRNYEEQVSKGFFQFDPADCPSGIDPCKIWTQENLPSHDEVD